MTNFNISFEFIDNLGETTITRAERRWNGVSVVVSKSHFQKLADEAKLAVLIHECSHAIAEFGLDNPKGWNEVDGVKLPSVDSWAVRP